jgi:hypothetical protein
MLMRGIRSVLVLAGVVMAGFLGAKLAHGRNDPGNTPPSTESVASPSTREELVATLATAKVASLEARLAAVEKAGQGGSSEHSPATQAAHMNLSQAHSPEERDRRIRANYSAHLQRIEDHKVEARDEDWAQKMETNITASLSANQGGASFKYEGVDCRKTTCVANVSWPSRGSAEGDLRKVLSSLIRTGCSREIFLPPADSSDGPTEGSVLLTCVNASAE